MRHKSERTTLKHYIAVSKERCKDEHQRILNSHQFLNPAILTDGLEKIKQGLELEAVPGIATTKKAEACLLGKLRLNLLDGLLDRYIRADFLSHFSEIIASRVNAPANFHVVIDTTL